MAFKKSAKSESSMSFVVFQVVGSHFIENDEGERSKVTVVIGQWQSEDGKPAGEARICDGKMANGEFKPSRKGNLNLRLSALDELLPMVVQAKALLDTPAKKPEVIKRKVG